MTVNKLMTRAANDCIDERERYLIIFTQGANGYVCRNEGVTSPSQALFHGSYRDCQVWIEQRGLEAALRRIRLDLPEAPGLSDPNLTTSGILDLLSDTKE